MGGFVPALARLTEEAVVDVIVPAIEHTGLIGKAQKVAGTVIDVLNKVNIVADAEHNIHEAIVAGENALQKLRHPSRAHAAADESHSPDHGKHSSVGHHSPAARHDSNIASTSPETVYAGSISEAVLELQHDLGVRMDGIAGEHTITALKAFQRAHDLKPDGVAGAKTWAALRAEPTVQEGSQGEAVRRIQHTLGVRADGFDGIETTTAVKEFQRTHGLVPDGIVGIHTWHALDATAAANVATTKHTPTSPTHSDGSQNHTIFVRYGDDAREIGHGYRQSGTIVSVQDGIVIQNAGRTTVEYRMSDLNAHAQDPQGGEQILLTGRNVLIMVESGRVQIIDLERHHEIDRSQQAER